MPTYGYHCDSCGTEFDVFQRMADEAKADCVSCGKAARRIFYPAGIVFKGSGFYKNDSRGTSPTASEVAKSSTESTGDSTPSSDKSTTESKPTAAETKTESKPNTPPPAASTTKKD